MLSNQSRAASLFAALSLTTACANNHMVSEDAPSDAAPVVDASTIDFANSVDAEVAGDANVVGSDGSRADANALVDGAVVDGTVHDSAVRSDASLAVDIGIPFDDDTLTWTPRPVTLEACEHGSAPDMTARIIHDRPTAPFFDDHERIYSFEISRANVLATGALQIAGYVYAQQASGDIWDNLCLPLLAHYDGYDWQVSDNPDDDWSHSFMESNRIGYMHAYAVSPTGATFRGLGLESTWRYEYSPSPHQIPRVVSLRPIYFTEGAPDHLITIGMDSHEHPYFFAYSSSDAALHVAQLEMRADGEEGALQAHVVGGFQTLTLPNDGEARYLYDMQVAADPEGEIHFVATDASHVDRGLLYGRLRDGEWYLDSLDIDYSSVHVANLDSYPLSVVVTTGSAYGPRLFTRDAEDDMWTHEAFVPVTPDTMSESRADAPRILMEGDDVWQQNGTTFAALGSLPTPTSEVAPSLHAYIGSSLARRGFDGTLYIVTSTSYSEFVDTSYQLYDEQLILYSCPPGGDCFCD